MIQPLTGIILSLLTLFGALASYFMSSVELIQTAPDTFLYTETVGGSGNTIIVVHGGPGLSHSYIKPFLLPLATEHTLLFYDQRGCGKSTMKNFNASTINIDEFIEDIEKIRTNKGLETITLLGHSYGSLLSLYYAAKYPEHVEKLILISTPTSTFSVGDIPDKFLPLYEPSHQNLDADTINSLHKEMYTAFFYNKDFSDELQFSLSENSVRVKQLLLGDHSYDEFQADLTTQTLVIDGLLGKTENLSTFSPFLNTFGVVFKDCGHFPFIEKNEDFTSLVLEFLSRESE